jgi:AraC family transcriptional regulator
VSNNEPPEHLHLLDSFQAGWEGLNLIYEIEPADEMGEVFLNQHFIVIALDNFRASYLLDGYWQYKDYAKGDIAIIPSNRNFPRTQIDREVPLLELLVDPIILNSLKDDSADGCKVELLPQYQIQDPLIYHMGLALMTEFQSGGVDSRLYAESMANALSVHLLSRYCNYNKEIKKYTDGLPQYKLRQVIEYINENLESNTLSSTLMNGAGRVSNLTLGELAFIAQMSPNYFASLFKQSTGLPPHQYVMKCRIEKAKDLLAKGDLSLVEISLQVGFQNQSHFTRVFKLHTNVTPKVYRDNC